MIYFLLIAGSIFLVFGIMVVFSSRFYNILKRTIWKDGLGVFSEKERYLYNKYISGGGSIITGLILLYLFYAYLIS